MADPLSDFDAGAFGGQRRENAHSRGDDDPHVDVDRLADRWCGESPVRVRVVMALCAWRQAVKTVEFGVGTLAGGMT